ncbi:MAG: 50S ribosomal protein L4 [Planctomycetota bacterium]
MASISTFDLAQGALGKTDFPTEVLGEKVLYRTLKDVVVQIQSNQRQGDAHTKIRSDLRGHKKKPWKQKKTGRARAGDRRSPLWVGGATVFGPRNTRRWTYHLPRKQRLAALRSALLGKIRDGEVIQLRGVLFSEPSSKKARGILARCAPKGSALVLLAQPEEDCWKSFRNFPRVGVGTAAEVNAYDLLAHKWLLAQKGALEALCARFSPPEEG